MKRRARPTPAGWATAATAALMMASAAPAQDGGLLEASALVTFGDAWSDAGNSQIQLAPLGVNFTPEEAGFFQGRWTNGPSVADILHQHLFGELSLASELGGTNYSVGIATIVQDIIAPLLPGPLPIPDFVDQVDAYLAAGVDPQALHFVAIGTDDTFAAALGGLPLEETSQLIGAEYGTQLGRLADAGAERFILATPFSAAFFPPVVDAVQAAMIDGAAQALNGRDNVETFVFDAASVIRAINAAPEDFGVNPEFVAGFMQDTPCFAVPGAAPACEGFYTVDGIHHVASIYQVWGEQLIVSAEDQFAAPRGIAAMADAALTATLTTHGRVESLGVAAASAAARPTAFGEIAYTALDQGTAGNALGFDGDQVAFTVGMAIPAGTRGVFGAVGFTAEQGEIDIAAGPNSSFDRASYAGFGVIGWSHGPLQLHGSARVGSEAVDDYTRATLDGRVAQADTDGRSIAVGAEARRVLTQGQTPIAGLVRADYVDVQLDGFTEKGAEGLTNLNSVVGDLENDLVLVGVGFELGGAPREPETTGLTPNLRVMYQRAVKDPDQTVDIALADFTEIPRAVGVESLGKDWVRVDAGVQAKLSERIAVRASATWRTDFDETDALAASAQVTVRF